MNDIELPDNGVHAAIASSAVVLKPSSARPPDSKKWTGPPDQARLGAAFDIHKPQPQNLVISLPGGGQQTVHLNERAMKIYYARNQGQGTTKTGPGVFVQGAGPANPITPLEAVELARLEEEAEAAGVPLTQSAAAPAAVEGKKTRSKKAAAELPVPQVKYAETSRVKLPAVKVRLTGNFGSFTHKFACVYKHEQLLVLQQESADGNFYEPPLGEEYVIVDIEEKERLACLPVASFPMPSHNLWVTLYGIDNEKTAEITAHVE